MLQETKSGSVRNSKNETPKSFLVQKTSFNQSLTAIGSVCAKRTTLDVTTNVLLEVCPSELVLRATDLEISFQATVPVSTSVVKPFSFIVHSRRLLDLTRDLKGQLCFDYTSGQLKISTDSPDTPKISLAAGSAEQFPIFVSGIENMADIDGKFLSKALSVIEPSIPVSATNPALNGLLIEYGPNGLDMVATDGHTLAKIHTDVYKLNGQSQWLLSKRSVGELRKILELFEPERVFLGVCREQLVFSGANFIFYTKILSHRFPDYRPALELDGFLSGKLCRETFLATLRRAGIILSGNFVSSKLTFEGSSLEFSLENQSIGSLVEVLPISDYSGTPVSCAFYSPYIQTCISQQQAEQVEFYIKDADSPIFFKSGNAESNFQLTQLVMPVVIE